MNFKKISQKTMSLVLAGCLSYSIVAPAITPAEAASMSYNVMIEPQYEDADYFSEGLAAVKKNGKWGYIDETGKTVIPFEYDYAFPFSEDLAVVLIQGIDKIKDTDVSYDGVPNDAYFWHIIDKNGNKTLLKYSNPESTDGVLFPVCTKAEDFKPSEFYYTPIYHNGYLNIVNFVYNPYYVGMAFDRNGKYAQVNNKTMYGEPIWPSYSFNEGLWSTSVDFDYLQFYLDEKGNFALEVSEIDNGVCRVMPFNQGLAPYAVYYGGDYNTVYYGFIDKNGNTVIEPQYTNFYADRVGSIYEVFNDNIASVQNKNGLWGGIDKTGKTVIPFEYDLLMVFNEGLAVAKKNGKYGVIDTNNNIVIPFEYDNLSSYSNGVCVAIKNGTAFCIDRYGNKITGSDTISQETYFTEGDYGLQTMTPSEVIVIKENNLYGFAKTDFTLDLPKESEMDSWAYDEVVKSIEADLVPASLQNQYKTNITRSDFALLVVALLEQASGKDIDTLLKEETGKTIFELVTAYPFTDTTDANVIAANALGIISGRGNGIFDPYASITRQEAAALLMRIGKYMGKTDVSGTTTSFTDAAQIQSYATEAVNYVNSLNVMKGTSDTTFSPNGTYTRQQAYITALRLYNALSE